MAGTLLGATPALAQGIAVWTGAVSSNWWDGTPPTNWNNGIIPDGTFLVRINTVTPNPAVIGVGGFARAAAGSLQIGLPGGNGHLTVQNGSHLTVNDGGVSIGTLGTGLLEVTSGSQADFGASFLTVGQGAGGAGTLTITGSKTVVKLTGGMAVADGTATGTINITDGGKLTLSGGVSSGMTLYGGANNAYAALKVTTGGTLEVGVGGILLTNVFGTTATATFDGGTLRALGSSSTLGLITTQPGTQLIIAAGGMIIDTNGYNVSQRAASSGPGAVTKVGAGTLTFTEDNTFAGGLIVMQGAVDGAAARTPFGTGVLTLASGTSAYIGAAVGTTVGGLAGEGTVRLSAPLTVNGSATTEFSGVIKSDCSICSNQGLVMAGTGTLILSGANTYTGPTTVESGTLAAGAAGAFSSASHYAVLSRGTLDLAGHDQTAAGLDNAGLVRLGGTPPGTTLTVTGAYVGQGGTLGVNSALSADGSASDKLIIDGGTASGSTILAVSNLNTGLVMPTTNLGIPVVVAQNGATTTTGAFSLGNNIAAAGAFEYLLFRGGDGATGAEAQNWYLRSHCTTNCGGNGGNGGNGGGNGGNPTPTPIPLYRPEASVYAASAGMARQLGMTLLGTFHERAGDQTLLRGSGPVPGAWGRWIGQKTEMSHGGPLMPKFDGTTNGLQAGLDLYGFDQPGYGSDRFGVFFGYARSLGDIDGFALGRQGYKAGKMDLSAYSLGGTWTHVGTGGWYIDAVLMGTSYDGDPRSHRGQSAKVKGYGVTASLESGYPLALGNGFTLEPQAQIVWQYLKLDNTHDRFATIAYDTPSTLSGRLGLRLSGAFQTGAMVLKPYVTANIWQEFAGSDKTIFSGMPMRSGGGNSTSAELTGGIATQVTGAVGLWGDVSYLTDISGPDRQAWRGNVGVRVTW